MRDQAGSCDKQSSYGGFEMNPFLAHERAMSSIDESINKMKDTVIHISKQRDTLYASLIEYGLDFTDEKTARAEFGNHAVDRELRRRAAIKKAEE